MVVEHHGAHFGERGLNGLDLFDHIDAVRILFDHALDTFDVAGGSHLPNIEIYGERGSLRVPDPNIFGGPVLLRQAAGLEKASINPGRDEVAAITEDQVAEIAKTKMPDLNANDLEAAKAQVAGTARSMGIGVV